MNWAWATSFDQLWRSQTFPMWLTLAAAGFFALILLFTLLRAEKSVANGALTVITLLAIGVAVAATLRGYGPANQEASGEVRSPQPISAGLPALSCIDDLAGDTVLMACEKTLFGSAEAAAAAVSYAASQITRLTALGNVAGPNNSLPPEIQALRRAVERDRYGLMAQVLLVRDHCTPSECAAFRALTDPHQIVANMDERTYDGLIARYAPSWNAPLAAAAPVAMLSPSMPTGKPTNADFPSAASTPAVSIMTPEPVTTATPSAARPPSSTASPPLPLARPSSTPTPAQAAAKTTASAPVSSKMTASALASAKKQPAPKAQRTAPVQLAPAEPPQPAPAAAAPAAEND
jgi:hypothetical protein